MVHIHWAALVVVILAAMWIAAPLGFLWGVILCRHRQVEECIHCRHVMRELAKARADRIARMRAQGLEAGGDRLAADAPTPVTCEAE